MWDVQSEPEWFISCSRMVSFFLPHYSPFLNPVQELFSLWQWTVYEDQPHDQILDTMSAGCLDIVREGSDMQKDLSQMDCKRGFKVWCGQELQPKGRRHRWQVLFNSSTRVYLGCVSSNLVALVHFGQETNCCAELHVAGKICMKSLKRVSMVWRNVS